MGHDKLYGICQNKCMVEITSKADQDTKDSTQDSKIATLESDVSTLKTKVTNKQDILTAGTGLVKSGNTLNHSNSVEGKTTYVGSGTAIPRIKYDSEGHITETSTVTVYPPTTVGTSGQVWTSRGTGVGEWTNALQKIPLQGTIESGSLTMTNVQSGDLVSIIVYAGDSSNYSVFTFILQTVSGGTRYNTMTPARLVSLGSTEEHYWEYLMVEYYNYKWTINLRRDNTSDFSYVKTNIVSFEGTILRG